MKARDLPNFPLLFEQIAHFLREVHPVGAQQEKDYKLACDALDTVGYTIYPATGICNGHPRSKPVKQY